MSGIDCGHSGGPSLRSVQRPGLEAGGDAPGDGDGGHRGGPSKHRRLTAQIVLMIPLMLFSLPGGLLADRVGKRSVIITTKVLELCLMLAGTVAFCSPRGGLLPLCPPGATGRPDRPFHTGRNMEFCPRWLPHEPLSAGNSVLETISNLAMLAGLAGGTVVLLSFMVQGLDLGGASGASPCPRSFPSLGLVRFISRFRECPPRSEGGLALDRLGWPGSRSRPTACLARAPGADLRLVGGDALPAADHGVRRKPVALARTSRPASPGRPRHRRRRGLPAGGPALRREGGVRLAALGRARADGDHAGVCPDRPAPVRDDRRLEPARHLQRCCSCRSTPCCNGGAGRPSRRDHRRFERPGLRRNAPRLDRRLGLAGPASTRVERFSAPRSFSAAVFCGHSRWFPTPSCGS